MTAEGSLLIATTEPIGKRLKRLRLARDLSQRDLSSPGVSYAYISRIEAGARTPSVKALRKLAAKLGVTVEYLETGKDRSLVDVLATELAERTDSPVRMVAASSSAHIRWKRDGKQYVAHAENLTGALLNAVQRERERDQLRSDQRRLAEQEASLR